MKKKIIFFTKYTIAGPSSRYRTYQYAPYFLKEDYQIKYNPLFPAKYITALYKNQRKPWLTLFLCYIRRFFQILFLRRYHIIFIEYELFPFMPFVIEKLLLYNKRNIILDYDDAVFHNYDKNSNSVARILLNKKIPQLLELANIVITGSPYLTNWVSKYNPKVIEIPTSINFQSYQKPIDFDIKDSFTVGWIGSSSTSKHILTIKEALSLFCEQTPNAKVVLVGFNRQLQYKLKNNKIELVEWQSKTELNLLYNFDVGIMPLDDTDFSKGKCGFKLIQYMACGKPTISTPLEANVKIDRNGENLFATTTTQWFNALVHIHNNRQYFKQVGKRNRHIIRNYYSVEENYKTYISIFNQL